MNNLEEIIRKGREVFDGEEPTPGHDLRFMKKLESRGHLIWLIRISAVAAGFIILAGLWFLYRQPGQVSNGDARLTLGVLRPEYKEVEQFYTTSLKEKISELSKISCIPDWKKKALVQEIEEITESDTQLLNELQQNPKNEVLVETILNQYKTKLELLDELLIRLQPICNNFNNNSHETKELVL